MPPGDDTDPLQSEDELQQGHPQQQAGRKRMADGNATKEEKRQRWLVKQEKKSQKNKIEEERDDWFRQNSQFAISLTMEDLEKIESDDPTKNNPQAAELSSTLLPYRDIKEGLSQEKGNNNKQEETYFIAEGTETVRLLLQQSVASMRRNRDCPDRRIPLITIKSIFFKTAAFFESPVFLKNDVEAAVALGLQDRADTESRDAGVPPFRVLVGSEEVQSKVVGFPFCRGALACGVVPSWSEDEAWLMDFLKSRPKFSEARDAASKVSQVTSRPLRILALDGICDTANLGSIVRSASAFGLNAIILSQDSCNVWYRRAVRVSMGHCCRIPCVRVPSLSHTLSRLHDELGVKSFAAVIDLDAECVLENVGRGDIPGAWCCVMGNEGNGISKAVAQACSTRIRIDMEEGVDSLSVPCATAILLHGLKEREEKPGIRDEIPQKKQPSQN